MKYLILIITIFTTIFAQDIKPFKTIKFDSAVKDMIVKDNKVIVGTDSGKMQVYDIKTDKIIKTVQLPKIKDFMGDIIDTRVASIDLLDDRYLLLSDSGIGGYSNIWIHDGKKLQKIISHEDKLSVVKARFIDSSHILLGFLSNEVALYDIKNKKLIYKNQISESKFSDFALNHDKTKAVFACESGILYIVDVKTGKIEKELKGIHLDNVYKVATKNGIITGAGQDRKASIYNIKNSVHHLIDGKFLVYATGLSPKGEKAAFALDEQNNIYIYSTLTNSLIAKLIGQKSTLNSIVFLDENTLFSASDDDTVIMWKLNN